MPTPLHQAQDTATLLKDAGCIIFDFDGVVVDSEPSSLGTLRETLIAFGLRMSLDEVRAHFLGKSLKTIEGYLQEKRGGHASEGFADAWQDALFTSFRTNLQRMPGITALLGKLDDARLPYCVASSSSFTRLGVALDATRMADRFANIFSAEQVRHGKPAPDLFLFAAKQMEVDPAHCLVIEDSPHGIRAATAAGMTSVGFVGGSHLHGIADVHKALLFEAGAAQVVDSYVDLIDGVGIAALAPDNRALRAR